MTVVCKRKSTKTKAIFSKWQIYKEFKEAKQKPTAVQRPTVCHSTCLTTVVIDQGLVLTQHNSVQGVQVAASISYNGTNQSRPRSVGLSCSFGSKHGGHFPVFYQAGLVSLSPQCLICRCIDHLSV